mgnify:CR=1 FL=1
MAKHDAFARRKRGEYSETHDEEDEAREAVASTIHELPNMQRKS